MRISMCVLICIALCSRLGEHESTALELPVGNVEWKQLFDGESLGDWSPSLFGGEGEVSVRDGSIVMEPGVTLTGIRYREDFPKQEYEIEIEARLLEGSDFFCGLTFPVGDKHCSFIVGGWGGAVVGLSSVDQMDASENDTTSYMRFEQKRWYRLRTRVTSERIECWIDGKQVVAQPLEGKEVSIRPEVDLSRPLGIAAFQVKSEIRLIRYRRLTE